MKKGLILFLTLIVGVVALGAGYQIFAAHEMNSEGFHDYLMPVKMSTMFFKDKVTFFLTTKDNPPEKIDDKVGWIVGIDTDFKQETGGKWPKIGADYLLTVINQNGKWTASVKNVKTQESQDINSQIMIEKNKVDFSVPLSQLEMKTEFQWQIAVAAGDNKKALPDLLKATKKGQKNNQDYKDYMNKNMDM